MEHARIVVIGEEMQDHPHTSRPGSDDKHVITVADVGEALRILDGYEQDRGMHLVALLDRAKALLAQGHIEAAAKELRQAVFLDPQSPQPFNLYGAAYELNGDLGAAGRMYRAALALDPGYEPALKNLERVTQWQYTCDGIDLGLPETV